jgi:hypothetical protein
LGGPSRSRRCLESAVDAISSLERDGGNRRTGTGMDFLVRERLGLCAIRPSSAVAVIMVRITGIFENSCHPQRWPACSRNVPGRSHRC